MDTWMIIAFAVGFTALTMLMGPWMWSSSWTKWRAYGGKADAEKAPKGPKRETPEDPTQRK